MDRFYIIKIEAGHRPRLEECKEKLTLKDLQAAVSGYVGVTSVCYRLRAKHPFIRMLYSKDGSTINAYATKLHYISRQTIVGDAIIVSSTGDGIIPFTADEADSIRDTIEFLLNEEFEEEV